MKKQLNKSLFSFFIALVFNSVAHAGTMPVYTDPSVSITVTTQSPSFTIVQDSNPTTGYDWQVKAYDQNLLEIIDTHYQKPDSPRVGAGGKMVWTFRAKPQALTTSAQTQITLVYARPWDPSDHPKTVVFNVSFQP